MIQLKPDSDLTPRNVRSEQRKGKYPKYLPHFKTIVREQGSFEWMLETPLIIRSFRFLLVFLSRFELLFNPLSAYRCLPSVERVRGLLRFRNCNNQPVIFSSTNHNLATGHNFPNPLEFHGR